MPTIHVKEKFTYTKPDGTGVPFHVGTHGDVPAEIADHPFVKAHCTALPGVVASDTAALITERDALVARLADAVAAVLSTGDANTALHDKLVAAIAERDDLKKLLDARADQITELQTAAAALTAERDDLANQVAELQAGGTSTGKKK